jgi:hypothetical protein
LVGPANSPVVETRDAFEETVGVVGHVARAGHPGDEIERPVVVAEMLMVVPQAGHEKAVFRVDGLGAVRRFQRSIRRDAHDAFAFDQHAHARFHRQIARIEQPRVAHDECAFRRVGLFARDTRDPLRIAGILRLL